MITPNRSGTVRGSKIVPNVSPSGGGHHAGQRAEREQDQPVDLRGAPGVAGTMAAIGNTSAAASMHCSDAGHHLLEGDQLDRQRRQHPVLDLLRVAELLHQRQGHGLDALEQDGDGRRRRR